MNICLENNSNIIKSKNRFFNEVYMNKLVDLIVEEDYSFLLPFIRSYFFIVEEVKYEKYYNMMKVRFPNQHYKCKVIFDLFKNWKPFEHYNMGGCRGAFLELLTFRLLGNKYSEDNIYRESKIIIGDYHSRTWDSIYYYENTFKLL